MRERGENHIRPGENRAAKPRNSARVKGRSPTKTASYEGYTARIPNFTLLLSEIYIHDPYKHDYLIPSHFHSGFSLKHCNSLHNNGYETTVNKHRNLLINHLFQCRSI